MTIKIYSTPTCIYCKKAKALLDSNNIPYEEINVIESQAILDDYIKKTGSHSVPYIEVDGEGQIGYNEDWLKNKISIQ